MGDPITNDQMEKLLNQQAQTIGGILKGASSSGSGPGGGGGGDMPSLKKADGLFASLIGTLTGFQKGVSFSATAANTFGEALGKIPGIGNTLGTAFGSATQYATNLAGGLKESTMAGAGHANDMVKFAKTVAESGMTNEKFIEQQRSLGTNVAGIGAGMSDSMEVLTGFQNDVKKSPIGKQLEALGFNAEEQAKFINGSLQANVARDLTDKNQRAAAVKAVEDQIEKTILHSKATGMSIEMSQKLMAQQEGNIGVQAGLMAQGQEAQAAYSAMLPDLAGMGADIQKMAEEKFVTGNIASESGAQTLTALGNAGPQLLEAVAAMKEASKEGASPQAKREAEQLMANAKNAVDVQMRDPNFLRRASGSQYGQDEGDEGASTRMFAQNQARLRNQMQVQNRDVRTGGSGDIARANEITREQGRREIAAITPEGKPGTGSAAIAAANQADAAARAEANAFAIKGLNAVGGAADAAGRKITEGLTNKLTGRVPTPGERTQGMTGGAPGGTPQPPARGARAFGTEETIGMLKEPKTQQLLIHEGENVLNPKDAEKWAKLGGQEGVDKLLSGITSMGQQAGGKVAPKADKLPFDDKQVAGMFNKIKMPIDDKQINSMFSNLKMPAMDKLDVKGMMPKMPAMPEMPKMPKISDAVSSSKATSSADMVSDLKTKISSATPPTPKTATADQSPIKEEPKEPKETVAADSSNTEMLAALTEISKYMSQLVAINTETNDHASKQVRATEGLSGNRFG